MRWEMPLRFRTVKRSEIVNAIGCSKTSASDLPARLTDTAHFDMGSGSPGRREGMSNRAALALTCSQGMLAPSSAIAASKAATSSASSEGWRRARVGQYRVIYRIDEDQRVVCVDRVDHRSDSASCGTRGALTYGRAYTRITSTPRIAS